MADETTKIVTPRATDTARATDKKLGDKIEHADAVEHAVSAVEPAKADITLEETLGNAVAIALANTHDLPRSRTMLATWYSTHHTEENGKQFAQDFRKKMETARRIMDSLYTLAVELSYRDL